MLSVLVFLIIVLSDRNPAHFMNLPVLFSMFGEENSETPKNAQHFADTSSGKVAANAVPF